MFDNEVKPSRGLWYSNFSSLNEIDFTNFNTSKFTSFYQLFMLLPIEKVDLSGLNTSNVTDMHYMFWSCNKLKNITF